MRIRRGRYSYTLVGGPDDGDFESVRKLLPHYPPAKSSVETLPERIIGFSFHDHRQRSSVKGETHLQTASKAIQDYVRIVSEGSDDGTQRGFLRKIIKNQRTDPFHEIYSYLRPHKPRIHCFGPTSSYDFLVTLDGIQTFRPELRFPPKRLYLEGRSRNLVRGLQEATGDYTLDQQSPDDEEALRPLLDEVNERCRNGFDIRDLETALCRYGKDSRQNFPDDKTDGN